MGAGSSVNTLGGSQATIAPPPIQPWVARKPRLHHLQDSVGPCVSACVHAHDCQHSPNPHLCLPQLVRPAQAARLPKLCGAPHGARLNGAGHCSGPGSLPHAVGKCGGGGARRQVGPGVLRGALLSGCGAGRPRQRCRTPGAPREGTGASLGVLSPGIHAGVLLQQCYTTAEAKCRVLAQPGAWWRAYPGLRSQHLPDGATPKLYPKYTGPLKVLALCRCTLTAKPCVRACVCEFLFNDGGDAPFSGLYTLWEERKTRA